MNKRVIKKFKISVLMPIIVVGRTPFINAYNCTSRIRYRDNFKTETVVNNNTNDNDKSSNPSIDLSNQPMVILLKGQVILAVGIGLVIYLVTIMLISTMEKLDSSQRKILLTLIQNLGFAILCLIIGILIIISKILIGPLLVSLLSKKKTIETKLTFSTKNIHDIKIYYPEVLLTLASLIISLISISTFADKFLSTLS